MEKEKITLIQRFIRWRENNIKEKQFILILSFLVGIFTAFAALILKFFIHSMLRKRTTFIWFTRWWVSSCRDGSCGTL